MERALLFWLLCIPLRLLIAWIVAYHGKKEMALAAFLIVVGFMMKVIESPGKGFFGGKTWWTELRKLHVLTWLIAALLLVTDKYYYAGVTLLLDAVVGMVGWFILS